MYLKDVMAGYQSGSGLAQRTMDDYKKAKEQKKIDGVKKAYQGMMTNPTFYDEKTAQPTPKGITFLYQHYDADAVKKVLSNTNNPYSSGFANQPKIDAKTGKAIESPKPVKLKPITEPIAKRMAHTLTKNKTIPLKTMFAGYDTDATIDSLILTNNRAGIINYLVGDTLAQEKEKSNLDSSYKKTLTNRQWVQTERESISGDIKDLQQSKSILRLLTNLINDKRIKTTTTLQSAIILKMARLMTGVGVLTESDIQRSLPSSNFWGELRLKASNLSEKNMLTDAQLTNIAILLQKLLNTHHEKYKQIEDNKAKEIANLNKKYSTTLEVGEVLPSYLDTKEINVHYDGKNWQDIATKENPKSIPLDDETKKALAESGL